MNKGKKERTDMNKGKKERLTLLEHLAGIGCIYNINIQDYYYL